MNKIRFGLLFVLFVSKAVFAQQIVQVVKGKVFDKETEEVLPFVNVVIKDTEPVIGSSSDTEGNFTLQNVPVGRVNVEVSYIGYETLIIPEVVVTAAKEVWLNIALSPNITNLTEIVIRPKIRKQEPLNNLATVSARLLSVEEAKRYAGGFDDPARLASSFPGVAGTVSNNAIVVRGNAPKFLQWKIEGVEIPNPNHFADLSAFGGGGLTAFSSNLLANSDFFTGAFPAEYNNALSGVFDIKMRSGNASKYEHSAEVGIIGIDFASEGPLGKTNTASYLASYRYSTLALIPSLLPEDAAGTKYQDLSFKLSFPTKKTGSFSVWGIGLLDSSGTTPETDESKRKYYQDIENQDVKQYMGASGINHKFFFGNASYINTTVAVSASGIDLATDRLDNANSLIPENRIKNSNINITLKSYFNKRFSKHHVNRSGITLRGLGYDLELQENDGAGNLETIANESGFTHLLAAYSNSGLTFRNFKMNLGITAQLFTLNNHYTIEPRIGAEFDLNNNSSLSMGYGLHSRIEPLNIYFAETITPQANKDLDFTKAHHFVLAYDWDITEKLHLKIEPYYQALFNVPIKNGSSESLLNLQNDWFITDTYTNSGKGRNYGIDLSLEQYMNDGFYYLISGSLFNSEYKAGDTDWLNTRFNKNYLMNVLAGKEFRLGRNKQSVLGFNFRISVQGGDRFSRIDIPASSLAMDVVYDETTPFTEQDKTATVLHTTVSYAWNRKKTSHKISLRMLNATNYKEFQGHRYNLETGMVEAHREALIIPNISYKISF